MRGHERRCAASTGTGAGCGSTVTSSSGIDEPRRQRDRPRRPLDDAPGDAREPLRETRGVAEQRPRVVCGHVDDDVVPDRRHRGHLARSWRGPTVGCARARARRDRRRRRDPGCPALLERDLGARRRGLRRRPATVRRRARPPSSRRSRPTRRPRVDGGLERPSTGGQRRRGRRRARRRDLWLDGGAARGRAHPRRGRCERDATSRAWASSPGADRWLCCLPCAHVGGLSVVTRALLTAHAARGPRRLRPRRAWPPRPRAARRSSRSSRRRCGASTTPRRSARSCSGARRRPTSVPANVGRHLGADRDRLGRRLRRRPARRRRGRRARRRAVRARARCSPAPTATARASTRVGPDGDERLARDRRRRSRRRRRRRGPRPAGRRDQHRRREGVADRRRARAARRHPGVARGRGVASADPEWGERVVAYVVPRGAPPTLDELRDHVAARWRRGPRPKELVVRHLAAAQRRRARSCADSLERLSRPRLRAASSSRRRRRRSGR